MWKRGVVAKGDFANWAISQEKASRGWWPFAYTLLADLEQSYTPEDEPLLERLYRSMAAGEGVFKITRRDRFPEVDRKIAEDVVARFPGAGRIAVHDVASSNGITSLELYRVLNERSLASVHASDWYDGVYLVTPRGSGWTVVFDADHEPLQYVGWCFVLSPRRKAPWRYPVNRVLSDWLRLRLLPRARSVFMDLSEDGEGHMPEPTGGSVRRVWLFHPECVATMRRDPHFTLGRHDLFRASRRKYHVVRAMNVLSPTETGRQRLEQAIRACAAGLVPGGLLVVGRNVDEEDSRPRTTAFALAGNRLLPAWDVHEGCELKDLIADTRLEPA
jgi:hypothetical protein